MWWHSTHIENDKLSNKYTYLHIKIYLQCIVCLLSNDYTNTHYLETYLMSAKDYKSLPNMVIKNIYLNFQKLQLQMIHKEWVKMKQQFCIFETRIMISKSFLWNLFDQWAHILNKRPWSDVIFCLRLSRYWNRLNGVRLVIFLRWVKLQFFKNAFVSEAHIFTWFYHEIVITYSLL